MYRVINMDIDFSEKLKGFDDVWRRVCRQKTAGSPAPHSPVKPARCKQQSRARRFDPGRR
jgi:hypothetical protein